MGIAEDIGAYIPFNEQERVDREFVLARLECDPQAFLRESPAHMTCSVWTVDPVFERTLMVYHNIYRSWSWIGGHADGERDLARVALRELREETGAEGALVGHGSGLGPGGIFSLEVLTVDGHEKRGRYVGSHLHLNVTYLAVADAAAPVRAKADENSAVRWVSLEDAVALSTEPWIRERIYAKLVAKTAELQAELQAALQAAPRVALQAALQAAPQAAPPSRPCR